jgi:HlyD family secretion protein
LSGSKAGLAQAVSLEKPKQVMKETKYYFKGIISKSDWDKSIASFEVAKASKESAYFSVKVLRLL